MKRAAFILLVLAGCATKPNPPLPMPPDIQRSTKAAIPQLIVTNTLTVTVELMATRDSTNWVVLTNWFYRVDPTAAMELFKVETK